MAVSEQSAVKPPKDAASGTEALSVFISYSRADRGTADTLVTALETAGFDVFIDRRDLPYGEEWQGELRDGIAAADTVIWLVSPASVASKWCNWELDEVHAQHKRLVPVAVGVVRPEDLPRQLGQIHILPVEGEFDLGRDLDTLVTTLETDRGWLRRHTRLADRARDWRERDRNDGLLLRGRALVDAEAWQAARPAKAPSPSPDILDLIVASQKGATKRQRRLVVGLGSGLVVALVLAGIAFWQSQVAEAETKRAYRETALSGWRTFNDAPDQCTRLRAQTKDGTGLYTAYCRIRTVMTYAQLGEAADMEVFLSGPHRDGKLLVRERTFGHYNPKMVDWVGRNLLPDPNDTAYIALTQPIYDEYFRTMGRAYHKVFTAYARHLDVLRYEQKLLAELVEPATPVDSKTPWLSLSRGRYSDAKRVNQILGLNEPGRNTGDHVFTALSYWVRRSTDGTADQVFGLLDRIVAIYDPKWHRTAAQPEGAGPWLPKPPEHLATVEKPSPGSYFRDPYVEEGDNLNAGNSITIIE